MTIEDIVKNLEQTDDALTICAARSPNWSPNSEAELCPADRVPKGTRFPYFLEISVAKNVLLAWSHLRGGLKPNLENKCEALIYYAENDAYILPEHERRQ